MLALVIKPTTQKENTMNSILKGILLVSTAIGVVWIANQLFGDTEEQVNADAGSNDWVEPTYEDSLVRIDTYADEIGVYYSIDSEEEIDAQETEAAIAGALGDMDEEARLIQIFDGEIDVTVSTDPDDPTFAVVQLEGELSDTPHGALEFDLPYVTDMGQMTRGVETSDHEYGVLI